MTTPHNKIPDELAQQIISRYLAGESSESLAAEYGINRITVPKLVHRLMPDRVKIGRQFYSKDEVKVCNKCESLRPLKSFHNDASSPDGKKSICTPCVTNYAKSYRSTEEFRTKNRAKVSRERDIYPERQLLTMAKSRAKKSGLDFNITLDDIVIPEKCPVLGIPLTKGTRRLKDSSPTLDRIDCSKGYVKGNVAVISWRANRIKGGANLEELRAIVSYVEKHSSEYRTVNGRTRKRRTGYRQITYDDVTKSLIDWAEHLGMSYETLSCRLNYMGWSIERAFTTPVNKKTRKREKDQ